MKDKQCQFASAIRTDIEDTVARVSPVYDPTKGTTAFSGWAGMAVHLDDTHDTNIGPAHVLGADSDAGLQVPATSPKCDISFSLHRGSNDVAPRMGLPRITGGRGLPHCLPPAAGTTTHRRFQPCNMLLRKTWPHVHPHS